MSEPVQRESGEVERTWVPRGVRLLDVDPDLAAGMSEREIAEAASRAVLPTVVLDRGAWGVEQLAEAHGVSGDVRGFVVVDGAVAVDLALAGHVCTRLITPTELVLLDGWTEDSIPVRAGFTVLEQATVAVLDDRLSMIAARWPGLMTAILKRAAQQVRHALLQQAIGQLPRVEHRLLALLWSIADRTGVARRDGVYVRLPVTHATLAQMIGARRPTVSLGLTALARRGLLTPEPGGWLLSRESLDEFPPPGARPNIVEHVAHG